MLHLIFQSVNNSLLQRIAKNDDVVFFENAIYYINKGNELDSELQKMHNNTISLHVLKPDIETRGFNSDDLILGIKVIEYSDLVTLTEKNKLVRTWS